MASHATDERFATKEIKVGLAVIAVLALAIAWVVARWFLRSTDVPAAVIGGFPAEEFESEQSSSTADPQPMILPPSDRYLGPAAYVQPRNLTPVQTPEPAPAPTFDHRPSLLPALPPEEQPSPRAAALPEVEPAAPPSSNRGRIRNAPIGDEAGERRQKPGDSVIEKIRADDWSSPPVQSEPGSAVGNDSSSPRAERAERYGRRALSVQLPPPSPTLADANPANIAHPAKTKPTLADNAAVLPTETHAFASGLPEILPINHAELQPGRKYLVEEGDSLPVIARFELGDSARWTELLFLNRDRLESWRDPLPPGTWLSLPADTNDSP